eukprot:4775795-Pyramimonas_sp.AAC.1
MARDRDARGVRPPSQRAPGPEDLPAGDSPCGGAVAPSAMGAGASPDGAGPAVPDQSAGRLANPWPRRASVSRAGAVSAARSRRRVWEAADGF